jgi:hypothetical protein
MECRAGRDWQVRDALRLTDLRAEIPIATPLGERQQDQGDDHSNSDDAPWQPSLRWRRDVAQGRQGRESIPKQVPDMSSLLDEEDGEEQ